MTHADIAAVIAKVPWLNAFGIGIFDGYRGRPAAEREAIFRRDQAKLLDDVDGCSRAEAWLRGKAKRKTINPHRSSYGLKHLAAHQAGYITNGAFIAAAIHCGFPYKLDLTGPNVGFGISERSLKATP
jgi:hypothetical protein